jgi:cytochrome P450
MYPPASTLTLRRTVQDTQWTSGDNKTYQLPKGSTILPDARSAHRNPDIWQDPNEFKPERWLNDLNPTRQGFYGFGGGQRICIGMNFSLLEQRIILSTLLRNYEWTLPGDSIHKDDIVSEGFGIIKILPMPIHFVKLKA